MTNVTLIPTEDQIQLMLESPMTEAELAHLEAVESRGTKGARTEVIGKIERAQSLLEVYNDKLFRGKQGGRTWGQYLQSIDLAKLGFVNGLDTEGATNWMNFGALCEAIDDWNDANPDRPALPYPGGQSYMQGWALLFDRQRADGVGTYAPITGAVNALQAWKTAVLKNGGDALKLAETRAIGRAARDAGNGRAQLVGADNSSNLKIQPAPRGYESTPEAVPLPEFEYTGRSLTAEERMAAAAAREAREEREASQRVYNASLKEDGIDPRLISVMEKAEFDVMAEAETYCNCMGRLAAEAQQLDVWVRGRINQYGTDGLDFLRQCDVGIYNVSDDIERITQVHSRLTSLIELLTDNIDPGDLTSDNFQSEPQK